MSKPNEGQDEFYGVSSRMFSIHDNSRHVLRQARGLLAALRKCSPETRDSAVLFGIGLGIPKILESAAKRMEAQTPKATLELRKISSEIFEGRPRPDEQVPLVLDLRGHKPPPREDPWRYGSFVHFHG